MNTGILIVSFVQVTVIGRKHLSTDCFSIKEDIACQIGNIGDEFDRIFYQKECREIGVICAANGLQGLNANFCFNQTAGAEVPITNVVTRTLAAEEFY